MNAVPTFALASDGCLWRDRGDHFTLEKDGESLSPGTARLYLVNLPSYYLAGPGEDPSDPIWARLLDFKNRKYCLSSDRDRACALVGGHDGPHKHGDRSWSSRAPLLVIEGSDDRYWYREAGLWLSTTEPLNRYLSLAALAMELGRDGQAVIFRDGRIECADWRIRHGTPTLALLLEKQAYDEHRQSRAAIVASDPDPRGPPDGPCSFCAEAPAVGWSSGVWKICAADDCHAAHNFHKERCATGSVDTEATRAESLRYGKRWLAELIEEDAKKKPGSCAFCVRPAEPQHPECLVAVCGEHERAGWRLTHCLAIGGVSDTPELRDEVLRNVAASDRFLEEGKRDATGARTERDYQFAYRYERDGKTVDQEFSSAYPDTVDRMKPPPEEVPLVGITPHYEWP